MVCLLIVLRLSITEQKISIGMKFSLSVISFMEHVCIVRSKRPHHTQGHLGFLLCFRSLVWVLHLDLWFILSKFLWRMWGLCLSHSSSSSSSSPSPPPRPLLPPMPPLPLPPSPLHVKKTTWSKMIVPLLVHQKLTLFMRICFWAVSILSLVYMSIILPIPRGLYYCSFMVSLEVR